MGKKSFYVMLGLYGIQRPVMIMALFIVIYFEYSWDKPIDYIPAGFYEINQIYSVMLKKEFLGYLSHELQTILKAVLLCF